MGADRNTPAASSAAAVRSIMRSSWARCASRTALATPVRGRAAVRDHGHAAQPEQDRAADACSGRSRRAGAPTRPRISRPPTLETGDDVTASRIAPTTVLDVPSIAFRATLPVKPSVTTTSSSPPVRSLPSTLPAKSSGRSARRAARAPRPRPACPCPAPRRSRAAPPAGRSTPVHGLHERRAHVGELDEVLGPHLVVGAGVEQQDLPARHRQQHRDRGAVDAADAPDVQRPKRPGRRPWGRPRRAPSASPAATARAALHDRRVLLRPHRADAAPRRCRSTRGRRRRRARRARSRRPGRRRARARRTRGRPRRSPRVRRPPRARRARSPRERARVVVGFHARARRPRGPCSGRRPGRRGAAAAATWHFGQCTRRRRSGSCAASAACSCASATVVAWGRPWRPRSVAARRYSNLTRAARPARVERRSWRWSGRSSGSRRRRARPLQSRH